MRLIVWKHSSFSSFIQDITSVVLLGKIDLNNMHGVLNYTCFTELGLPGRTKARMSAPVFRIVTRLCHASHSVMGFQSRGHKVGRESDSFTNTSKGRKLTPSPICFDTSVSVNYVPLVWSPRLKIHI